PAGLAAMRPQKRKTRKRRQKIKKENQEKPRGKANGGIPKISRANIKPGRHRFGLPRPSAFKAGKPRQAAFHGLLRFPVDLLLQGLAHGRLSKTCKAICGSSNTAPGPALEPACCRIASTPRHDLRRPFAASLCQAFPGKETAAPAETQRPVMLGARPPFHGATGARGGVISESPLVPRQ